MKWLRDNDYRYLVVSRERTRHFDPEAAVCIETASRHGVHLHKVVSDDGQELRLHGFSEERANKERAIVERFAGRFEQALTQLSEGLSRPRTEKRASKIRERIGRLKAKSRGIAQHYHIDIDTNDAGERIWFAMHGHDVAGAWYGVEQVSRGALLLAGVGAFAWLVWPEATRFLIWRRQRRAEVARARLERAMSRADREVATA